MRMSGEDVAKYQNGTGLISGGNKEPGLGLVLTLLLSLTLVVTLALVLYFVYSTLRKRSLDDLRHRLVPLYHFDPGECEEWEGKLLETSKRQITRPKGGINEFFSLRREFVKISSAEE